MNLLIIRSAIRSIRPKQTFAVVDIPSAYYSVLSRIKTHVTARVLDIYWHLVPLEKNYRSSLWMNVQRIDGLPETILRLKYENKCQLREGYYETFRSIVQMFFTYMFLVDLKAVRKL